MADEGDVAVVPRPRRPREEGTSAPTDATPPRESAPPAKERPRPVPTVLDFFPLEDPKSTELHAFFDHVREGRLTTTKCRHDREIFWPPRTVCPKCHRSDLEWVDLPTHGTIYSFSAVLAGAPLGMEADVPFAVGLVDLDGVPLRLFGRIDGAPWNELAIGQTVRWEPFDLADGRVFYRFRAERTAP